MAISFNNSGANSLTKLTPGNSKTMGSVTTSATGNTVVCLVDPLSTRVSEYAPPGSQWSASRTAGYLPRAVLWVWKIRCASDADLNAIERLVDLYIADGRMYAIEDSFSRSSDYAVLSPRGTRRMGRRMAHPDGGRSQLWNVAFRVLWPKTGASQL